MITQRSQFILELCSGHTSFSELCRKYGVSRTAAYKWKRRFDEEGLPGLKDRSRKPLTSGSPIPHHITTKIVAYREAHPSWGATKIRTILLREFRKVPSRRTIHRVLQDCNLVTSRQVRRRRKALTERVVQRAHYNNHVWTVDFKGWWRTKDARKVYPLTIRDEFSKYILAISLTHSPSLNAVKTAFEKVFLQFGLPEYIRSDNGSPFSFSQGLCGLSRLSAWWLKLGIVPNFIPPASPQYNGGHERMHRDMAKDLQQRPARNLADQQVITDGWREDFNLIRPHAALNDRTPAEVYKSSSLRYSLAEHALEYPSSMLSRYVNFQGQFKYGGQRVFLSKAIGGENIGLKFTDQGSAVVYFGTTPLVFWNHTQNTMCEFDLVTGKISLNKCAA